MSGLTGASAVWDAVDRWRVDKAGEVGAYQSDLAATDRYTAMLQQLRLSAARPKL